MSSQTVIGIFETKAQARKAVDHLAAKGFSGSNIDVSGHGSEMNDSDHERTDSFFTNAFGQDPDAIHYRNAARKGTVVTFHANNMEEAERAAVILDEHGALNVADKGRESAASTGSGTGTSKSIPVIEEEMQVGKREIETGGVRLRSRILEKPVEETLRLREEHVYVERHPVDRPASKRDFDNFKEGESKIVEHAEKPIVNKQARVVEEVNIGKETTQHTETVRGTERKTDVEVNKIDPKQDTGRDRGKV